LVKAEILALESGASVELAQLPRPPSRTAASLSSETDEGLVAAIAGGSDAAFEALYSRHAPGMLAMARHMLDSPSEAEDAVQHAFMAAYREIDGGVRPAYPRAWLYAIARNRCLNLLRDRREVADPEAAEAEPSTVGLAEEVERRSELRDLLRDMHRLPEEQRTALALFEMGGLTQAEIAKVMEVDGGRVKALVFQARTNLIHARAAADATCESVRSQLATLRGGRLNSRELRTHVRDCEGCAEYAEAVREQRRRLAIVLPVVPLMAALKAPVIGGGVATVGGSAGTAIGSAGRKALWLRPRPSVVAAVVAGTVIAAAVVTAVLTSGDNPPKRDRPARQAAAAAVGATGTAPAAKATAVAKPASKQKRAAAKNAKNAKNAKKAKNAKNAKKAAAPAKPAAATPPEVAAQPQSTPTAAAPAQQPTAPPAAPVATAPPPSSPSPAPSPPPAQPPGQDFDLDGEGTAPVPQAPPAAPETTTPAP
jgi:RNA polymerase sigma factor (sigma-70 family)